MKITENALVALIKEEVKKVLSESLFADDSNPVSVRSKFSREIRQIIIQYAQENVLDSRMAGLDPGLSHLQAALKSIEHFEFGKTIDHCQKAINYLGQDDDNIEFVELISKLMSELKIATQNDWEFIAYSVLKREIEKMQLNIQEVRRMKMHPTGYLLLMEKMYSFLVDNLEHYEYKNKFIDNPYRILNTINEFLGRIRSETHSQDREAALTEFMDSLSKIKKAVEDMKQS